MTSSLSSNAPDIRLVQNAQYPAYSVTIDWKLLGDGTLDESQALATAVVVALGTNRLALADDILPDPDSSDRMGWWGDMDADTIWNGWPIGSRLWLMRRSKINSSNANAGGNTVVLVRNMIYEAIQPFVDRRICSRFEAVITRTDTQTIKAAIVLYRGPLAAVQLNYEVLWNNIRN